MPRTFGAACAALLITLACSSHAETPCAPYAQQLVDATLHAHPELTILALHVTPPSGTENVIVASNIGRIGKPADADDLSVLRSGEPRIEVTKTGDLSVELPMHDAAGHTIGVMGSTFHFAPGGDRDAIVHRAQRVSDELAERTPSLSALFLPAH
jgi:hypothetical protein